MIARDALIAVLGPTGVGKTEVAIRLASQLDGEIISADSRLLYRGMDIGTAKPSPDQLASVAHHLIDVAEPDEEWSLAVFRAAALEAITAVQARGRLPLLVGGTGQYIRAILEGWSPPPGAKDEGLRRELENFSAAHGHEALRARLAEIDPVSAARIDSRNVRRVVRALEIHLLTNQLPSRVRKRSETPFRSLKILLSLPRRELYARIDNRSERMIERGLVDEVRGLLARGFSPDLPAMSAIGYRQIVAHLQGKMTLDEALAEIRRASRRLVRHQANWFKEDDPRNHVFEAREGIEKQIADLIQGWLGDKIMD